MIDNTGSAEDTLVMPTAWRRARHPRRDRSRVPVGPTADGTAPARVRSLQDEVRDEIERVLAHPGTALEIAAAGRAHLRGEPDPLGAAAVALIMLPLQRLYDDGRDRLLLDAWIGEHGVAFAAAAFADLTGTRVEYNPIPGDLEWKGVQPLRDDQEWRVWWMDRATVRRLRAHIAAAPGDVYDEAVAKLAERRRHPAQRLATAYLAPTREDWVEDLCANHGPLHAEDRWMAFCALGRPHQPAALGVPLGFDDRDLDVLASLIDGVGAAPVVPLLVDALDDTRGIVAHLRTLVDVLAVLPVDDAFQALADRIDDPLAAAALHSAAARFPARALRLLPASDAPQAGELLAAHVRTHPELAVTLLPELPAEARAAIQAVPADDTRLPAATDLPPLLTEPPWTRRRKKAEPVVIAGLPSPGIAAVTWEEGEREDWTSRAPLAARWADRVDHHKLAGHFDRLPAHEQIVLMLKAPDELADRFLADWEPPNFWDVDEWMRVVIGRFELDAHNAALSAARRNPATCSGLLLPLLSDEIARTMADWLVRLKSAGKTARAWFRRHGVAAVPPLLPAALDKPGSVRRAAEAALRLVADRHGPEPIVEAARVHGAEAAAAIEALLSADPLEALPAKIPALPDWADPRLLPQLLLRDRTHALPDDAARHVLTMLAMSKPDDAYAGVRVVRELCDPESVAEFGWALFQRWQRFGAPAKASWALGQLALTGDDETVRRLTPVIRAWPGEGGHAKAVTGLDVLAAIGTETALMHLHSVSQRVKFKALKTRAQEKIEQVAADLELTAEQLADRLVPDFGLDASGTLTLDYGPRRFTVGFDEHLKPIITDEDGKRRKSLPKPGAKDDPELGPTAAKRFGALKKDVRTIASDQLRRLEQAMVTRRRWSPAEFETLFAGHPLLRHIVRRLVWLACSPGQDGPAFRVAEDGTYANAADDTIVLAESARLGIAHPVDLGDDLPAWTELFADYEILQPFEQLGRPVHALTDDERESGRLTRFENRKVPTRAVLGLVNRGWERGEPQDAGVEGWISRPVGSRHQIVVALEPGIPVGAPDLLGDQTLSDVRLSGTAAPRLGDLDPVTASEVLADLTSITDGTTR